MSVFSGAVGLISTICMRRIHKQAATEYYESTMQPVQAKRIFEEHGVRYTQRRHAVFASLFGVNTHPTAEELQEIVREQGSEVSTATIYNTLDLFCRNGLVRRLPMPSGGDRYDAETGDHLHLRLDDTDQIVDVPEDLAQALFSELDRDVLSRIEDRMGVRIDRLGLHLIGHRSDEA